MIFFCLFIQVYKSQELIDIDNFLLFIITEPLTINCNDFNIALSIWLTKMVEIKNRCYLQPIKNGEQTKPYLLYNVQ